MNGYDHDNSDDREWDSVQDPNTHDHYAAYASNPLRTFVQVPTFISMLGSNVFETAIDLGCGDGSCARIMYESGVADHVSALDTNVDDALNETAFDEIHFGTVEDITRFDTNQVFDCVCAANGPKFLLNRAPEANALRTLLSNVYKVCGSVFIAFVYNPFLKAERTQFRVGEKVVLDWQSAEMSIVDGAALNITSSMGNAECFWYSAETIERICNEIGFGEIKWIKPQLYAAATYDEVQAYASLMDTPPFYGLFVCK
jgi:hypothetical protein